MVSIRLDPEEPGWEKTALRCLKAGATLYGVPESKLETLTPLAEEHGLDLVRDETDDGWRVTPTVSDSSSSVSGGPAPASDADETGAAH